MFTLGFSGCGSSGRTPCSGSGCTPPPATPEILYGAPSTELLNQFINATIDPNTGGFSSVSVGTIPLFDTGGMVAVNARFLYISTTFVNGLPNNGSEIFGYSINPTTGTLAPIAGSPFRSQRSRGTDSESQNAAGRIVVGSVEKFARRIDH